MLLLITLNITMKSLDHINIDCENSLYLVLNNVNRYTEKHNQDKYLIFAAAGKSKEILEKYTKLWNEIKNQIKIINGGKLIEYKKDFMKIRFESDDDLPLSKTFIILVVVVTGSVFPEENILSFSSFT